MRIRTAIGLVLVAAPVFAMPADGPSFLGEWTATASTLGGDVSETLNVVKTVLAAVMALSFDAWRSDTVVWIVALGAPVALFAILAVLLDTPTAVATVVRAVGRWLYQ